MRHKMMNVMGHIEIFDENGRFLFSADNEREALQELADYLAEMEDSAAGVA